MYTRCNVYCIERCEEVSNERREEKEGKMTQQCIVVWWMTSLLVFTCFCRIQYRMADWRLLCSVLSMCDHAKDDSLVSFVEKKDEERRRQTLNDGFISSPPWHWRFSQSCILLQSCMDDSTTRLQISVERVHLVNLRPLLRFSLRFLTFDLAVHRSRGCRRCSIIL